MEPRQPGEPGTDAPEAGKAGATADPGHLQPEAAEVESARLLANGALEELGEGADEERVRRLADEFVAAGGQGDLTTFLRWMAERDTRIGGPNRGLS
jgi:hypothetical protein